MRLIVPHPKPPQTSYDRKFVGGGRGRGLKEALGLPGGRTPRAPGFQEEIQINLVKLKAPEICLRMSLGWVLAGESAAADC